MPVLYIHGVATRDRDGFLTMEPYLRRLVAPAMADDPQQVLIDDVFWGDIAATFAWDGVSRPRSRLLRMGAEAAAPTPLERAFTAATFTETLKRLPASAAPTSGTGALISGSITPAAPGGAPIRLQDLQPGALSDLLAILVC